MEVGCPTTQRAITPTKYEVLSTSMDNIFGSLYQYPGLGIMEGLCALKQALEETGSQATALDMLG